MPDTPGREPHGPQADPPEQGPRTDPPGQGAGQSTPPGQGPQPQPPPQPQPQPGPPGGIGPQPWHPQGPYGPYAPHTPYGPGPHGPYGPYGWSPWGPPPPPPPKPGVIPLAPLGVDQIFGGAFATIRRYARPLFGAGLAAYAVLTAVMAATVGIAYAATSDHLRALNADGAAFSWEHARPLLIAFGTVWLVGLLGTLAVNSFVQASCAATLHEAVLGRPASWRAVWRRAWSRTPSVAGVTLLLGLILLLPVAAFALFFVSLVLLLLWQSVVPIGLVFLLALVLLPLAAWLYVLFAFAPAAAVLESAGPLTALRRSARLVRGAWWRTFGISLLAAVMVGIVAMVFQVPLQLSSPRPTPVEPGTTASTVFLDQLRSQSGLYAVIGLVGTLVTQLITAVFLPLVTALLYVDRRIRTEGLAHTLTEASAPAPEPSVP
ncbi:hypothetical protein [Streptomyces sp. NPDC052114]|uniref:DUF7847 domain-containing protein n=1 Tax=unclassified Streptomyces TaxID=2593676 RepID=UPI003436F48B